MGRSPLANRSITISTTHYDARNAFLVPSQNTTELFFHPLNGYAQSILT